MTSNCLRYKYCPFNEGSLSIIENGTVKFTNPKDFNDPFDCFPEIDEDSLRILNEQRFEIITKEKLSNVKVKPRNYFKVKNKHKAKLHQELSTERSIHKLNEEIGIFCLSRNPLNLLMWAHYASSHTGFVVEFSIPDNSVVLDNKEDIYNLVPLPVEYEHQKPVIFDRSRESLKKWLFTKSKDWEYEQEERVFNPRQTDDGIGQGPGIHSYNRKIVKAVIAGMRMNDNEYSRLKNIIKSVNDRFGLDIALYKAIPIKGRYALFVPGRDELNIHNRQFT